MLKGCRLVICGSCCCLKLMAWHTYSEDSMTAEMPQMRECRAKVFHSRLHQLEVLYAAAAEPASFSAELWGRGSCSDVTSGVHCSFSTAAVSGEQLHAYCCHAIPTRRIS
jgi:hypothetical protein